MILASVTTFLAAVDGFVGFGLGLFVGWWLWRHRPPDRKYSVDLTIHHDPTDDTA
jgi:hypothetical protein